MREFLYADDVCADGLSLTGSGQVTLASLPPTRAPRRPPGKDHREDPGGWLWGALHFDVDLGPSHQLQQYQADNGTTPSWASVRVRIRPVPG